MRFCDSCSRKVYYCGTIEEAREHAIKGDCVALDASIPRSPSDLDDPEESFDLELDGLELGEIEGEEVIELGGIELEEE